MNKYIVVCVNSYEHEIEFCKSFESLELAQLCISKDYYTLLYGWVFDLHQNIAVIDAGIQDNGAWLVNEDDTIRFDWYIQKVEVQEIEEQKNEG